MDDLERLAAVTSERGRGRTSSNFVRGSPRSAISSPPPAQQTGCLTRILAILCMAVLGVTLLGWLMQSNKQPDRPTRSALEATRAQQDRSADHTNRDEEFENREPGRTAPGDDRLGLNREETETIGQRMIAQKLEELDRMRSLPSFKQRGFGTGGPHHHWLIDVKRLRDDGRLSFSEKVAAGDLLTIGLHYATHEGRDDKVTTDLRGYILEILDSDDGPG